MLYSNRDGATSRGLIPQLELAGVDRTRYRRFT